jgi:hypothetical protein
MLQCDLSATELWTFTTNPDERNARARVLALEPDWSLAQAIAWLAAAYPHGLTEAGLVEIDEELLKNYSLRAISNISGGTNAQ